MSPFHPHTRAVRTVLRLGCLALALLGARPMAAQDSTKKTTIDSVRRVILDSVRAADSARAARSAAPVDSTLLKACSYGKGGGSAPGLLGVLFQKRSTDEQRKAAAASVGGTLIPLGGREAFVRVKEGGMSLRNASDKLIGAVGVAGVSEVPCPS
jgi:hypothetical protein